MPQDSSGSDGEAEPTDIHSRREREISELLIKRYKSEARAAGETIIELQKSWDVISEMPGQYIWELKLQPTPQTDVYVVAKLDKGTATKLKMLSPDVVTPHNLPVKLFTWVVQWDNRFGFSYTNLPDQPNPVMQVRNSAGIYVEDDQQAWKKTLQDMDTFFSKLTNQSDED